MALTRKHYTALAEAIRKATVESTKHAETQGESFVLRRTLSEVKINVAQVLAEDNPKFDQKKFLDACLV